ncbi:MAG: hypothetical protein HYX55_11265 [Chloroflexi bacterium]|nr:hypothetical protein [Chloroflexota bacterium]
MTLDELLADAARIRDAVVREDATLAALPLAAIGWATVEHERAERELEAALGPGAPWLPLDRDPALGARRWARAAVGRSPAVVILEPDTEGRLAASLARFGEAVATVYLGTGPVGQGRLIRGGHAWGPHVVVLAP